MKLSKYNIVHTDESGSVILNARSGGVLGLNRDFSNQFKRVKDGEDSAELSELIAELTKGGMLVDEDLDEDASLKLESLLARFRSRDFLLTIAPTMGCNFACPYCYEKGREKTVMSDKVADKLVEFVKERCEGMNRLFVGWYGGEPLLCIDRICTLTRQLKQAVGQAVDYSASIVSNGYLLTRDIALRLVDASVRVAQITIDGSKEDHDARRVLNSGMATYDSIIENIANCADILKIVVRINVDKTNVGAVSEILTRFEELGLKNKVSITLAPVENINDTCSNDIHCMSIREFSEEEISFYRLAVKRGFMVHQNFGFNPVICGAVSLNAYVVDPLGDLYKCWDEIGDLERRVGSVFDGVSTMNRNIIRWLSYEPDESECQMCAIRPMCMGGCPHHAINGRGNRCISSRFSINQQLVLAREIKQMTMENLYV